MNAIRATFLAGVCSLAACMPEGGDTSDNELPVQAPPAAPSGDNPPPPDSPPPTDNPPPSDEPTTDNSGEPLSDAEAVRFIQQAAFGASPEELEELKTMGIDAWIVDQMTKPSVSYLDRLIEIRQSTNVDEREVQTLFWERALHGEDQLRQRMAFALSQIVVLSLEHPEVESFAASFGVYADLLQDEALGNYCQLVRDVSLTPSMGIYLTHLGNRKADPDTGFVPDENYAREVMQLFTIGLEELDAKGRPLGRETYSIEDVEGLAEVFTGLSWANTDFDRPKVTEDNRYRSMESFPSQHEGKAKTFLGASVNVGTDAVASVNAALDVLLAHPNVAPFISKQLIQKLVTSNPSPDYVGRVAAAFEAGTFTLPSGATVGTGERCDLAATAAAILSDEEARTENADPTFGKIRSPILRLAQFLRTFKEPVEVTTSGALPDARSLKSAEDTSQLGMNAFASPSVFNFYRPGYAGPGTESAKMGLVTPEYQVLTTPSLVGFINEIKTHVKASRWKDGERYITRLDLAPLLELSNDPAALVDELDRLLTGGRLSEEVRGELTSMVEMINIRDKNPTPGQENRVQLALTLIATAPAFTVQQ